MQVSWSYEISIDGERKYVDFERHANYQIEIAYKENKPFLEMKVDRDAMYMTGQRQHNLETIKINFESNRLEIGRAPLRIRRKEKAGMVIFLNQLV